MRMIFRYESGIRVEAIVLAIDGSQMRAAIHTADDAAIFVRSGGYWHAENGEIVEIEAAAFDENEARPVPAIERPKVMTAGGWVAVS